MLCVARDLTFMDHLLSLSVAKRLTVHLLLKIVYVLMAEIDIRIYDFPLTSQECEVLDHQTIRLGEFNVYP